MNPTLPRLAAFGVLVSVLVVVCALTTPIASAQPANAPPGSICVTPNFWCRASQRGPVGAPCACPSPNGFVRGVLR